MGAISQSGGGGNTRLLGEKTIDFASISAGAEVTDTITVTGAVVGDVVAANRPLAAVNAQLYIDAWVSAADTVTLRLTNEGLAPFDPASATYKVIVFQ